MEGTPSVREVASPVETEKRPFFWQTFQALRHRDFLLFWIALTISLLGVSFQTVAQSWLVYRLTGSATMLGLTGFIPAVLAAPASIVGGILADRYSRRKIVICTQTLMILPPVALAALIGAGLVQPWHVIVATVSLAVIAALDLPSRTAMVSALVPEDDLLNAQGLANATGQLTRVIGPAMAGLVVAQWGEAIPYLVNGLSYLAMVGALLLMSSQAVATGRRVRGAGSGLMGGVRYILKTPMVAGLLVIAAAQGLFLSAYIVLLPIYSDDILHLGAQGFGWLNSAVGIGAMLGALGVMNLKKGRRGQILNIGSLLMPFVLAGFAWSGMFGLSFIFLLLLGLGVVVIRTIAGAYLLTVVPDELRGRVMSIVTLIYYGAPYAAGLPVGFLAERWSAPGVLILSGGLFMITILAVNVWVPAIRQQE